MLDLFQYDFMQRALLAMVAMSLFSPVLGIFLILRRQSLMSDTLSHVSLAGVAFGLFLGISPTLSTMIIVIIAAVFLEYVSGGASQRVFNTVANYLRKLGVEIEMGITTPFGALPKVRGVAALPHQEQDIREDQKRMEQAKKRLATLDVVMSRLYEDNALGEISKEKYKKMTADYEAEQERLKLEIEATLAESTLERRKTA